MNNYLCYRCKHEWSSRKEKPPKVCPKCKSPYWNVVKWKNIKEDEKMQVELGGNDFFGVPFPLVLADRFFHIYGQEDGLKLDVFRWDEQAQQAIYEVIGSEAKTQNITNNPTGIITFSRENDGAFLYKFRPKNVVSQIFGKIPINEEYEIKINDRAIEVKRSSLTLATFQENTVTGYPIGIRVEADGSIGMGVNWLPPGMKLIRRTDKS